MSELDTLLAALLEARDAANTARSDALTDYRWTDADYDAALAAEAAALEAVRAHVREIEERRANEAAFIAKGAGQLDQRCREYEAAIRDVDIDEIGICPFCNEHICEATCTRLLILQREGGL